MNYTVCPRGQKPNERRSKRSDRPEVEVMWSSPASVLIVLLTTVGFLLLTICNFILFKVQNTSLVKQAYELYVRFASLLVALGSCNNHLHTNNKDHEDTQRIPSQRYGRKIQKLYSFHKETNFYFSDANISTSCILLIMDYFARTHHNSNGSLRQMKVQFFSRVLCASRPLERVFKSSDQCARLLQCIF
ncbi:hypothetical protein pdam_00024868 [Pocillopora damicornis]|uniref:Uncharacterized protein n=1 Tax=Pocillopora damicornis TaxID=46731 RepID=A0A3M6U199_POCDA|nr:hypothetical protein pdam_00024868 [Pocillopora damicornis]